MNTTNPADELRHAFSEENTVDKRKYDALERLYRQTMDDLEKKILEHSGQKFAFVIEGQFEKTIAFGILKNTTRPESFHFTFIGRIKETEAVITETLQNFLSIQNGFLFPSEKLFVADEPLPRLFKKADALYLNFYQRNDASWNLEDLLECLFPDDLRERLKREHSDEGSIIAKFYIGQIEFEQFITEKDQGGYLALAVKNSGL